MLPISKPLDEDPANLGNIRKPRVVELHATSLEGVPRFNWYIGSVLQGDDGVLCAFFAGFNCFDKAMRFNIGVIRGEGGFKPLGGLSEAVERYTVERFENKDEVVVSNVKKDIQYTIREDGYNLLVDRICGDNKVHMDLEFQDLMTFWYNKGKVATILPDGTKIFGFEQISHASGHMTLNGEELSLRGYADHEHFFNAGDIIDKLKKFGGEFWMPFSCDKIRGIFVVFHKYKDAGILIDAEYIIPRSFKIRKVRWINQVPVDVDVSAETHIGTLNLAYRAIGNMFTQNPARLSLTLRYRNGKTAKINGLGWIEHIY